MEARAFYQALLQKIDVLRPRGYSGQWTSGMYPVLYEVGNDAGFYVNCKPFDYNGVLVGEREIQNIDFMYFPRRFEPGGYIYYHPTVVIEHENNWDLASKQGDFWKGCLFISRLRVFIGYCSDRATSIEHADKLCDFYLQHEMQQMPKAQTLVLLSWDDANGKEWIVRLLEGDGREWLFLN